MTGTDRALVDRGYLLAPGLACLTAVDLLDELAQRMAGVESDRLSAGEAIHGAPGACGTCGHHLLWHRRHGHHECERCDCPSMLRVPWVTDLANLRAIRAKVATC